MLNNELEEQEEESKANTGFRASLDLFMGIIYVLISSFCVINPGYVRQFGDPSTNTIYIIAALFCFYGLFRVFRGCRLFQKTFMHRK